jgi:hypothetical protein
VVASFISAYLESSRGNSVPSKIIKRIRRRRKEKKGRRKEEDQEEE